MRRVTAYGFPSRDNCCPTVLNIFLQFQYFWRRGEEHKLLRTLDGKGTQGRQLFPQKTSLFDFSAENPLGSTDNRLNSDGGSLPPQLQKHRGQQRMRRTETLLAELEEENEPPQSNWSQNDSLIETSQSSTSVPGSTDPSTFEKGVHVLNPAEGYSKMSQVRTLSVADRIEDQANRKAELIRTAMNHKPTVSMRQQRPSETPKSKRNDVGLEWNKGTRNNKEEGGYLRNESTIDVPLMPKTLLKYLDRQRHGAGDNALDSTDGATNVKVLEEIHQEVQRSHLYNSNEKVPFRCLKCFSVFEARPRELIVVDPHAKDGDGVSVGADGSRHRMDEQKKEKWMRRIRETNPRFQRSAEEKIVHNRSMRKGTTKVRALSSQERRDIKRERELFLNDKSRCHGGCPKCGAVGRWDNFQWLLDYAHRRSGSKGFSSQQPE